MKIIPSEFKLPPSHPYSHLMKPSTRLLSEYPIGAVIKCYGYEYILTGRLIDNKYSVTSVADGSYNYFQGDKCLRTTLMVGNFANGKVTYFSEEKPVLLKDVPPLTVVKLRNSFDVNIRCCWKVKGICATTYQAMYSDGSVGYGQLRGDEEVAEVIGTLVIDDS